MASSHNTESLASTNNEFRSRVPPAEPLTRKGHAPGVKVGNEAVPEFHAETYEPGTAPREDTYQPNPIYETPGQNSNSSSETYTDPASTLMGSTSADVHQGLGKPLQGQEGTELHGGHGRKAKSERTGLEGLAPGAGLDSAREKGADLPEGVYRGVKSGQKEDPSYPGAEDKIPESAETVARENQNAGHD